jgi:hypothetical protein
MDTYARIRMNRLTVQGSSVFVILFSIAGVVLGIRSEIESTVLQAVATAVAMALPAAFALVSLERRPALLPAAVFAAAVIGVTIPEFLPVWLVAGGAWIFAIRNRPRPLPEPRWVWLGRPLLAVTVIVPLILLFGHADPACTLAINDGRVEQVDPAVRGLDSGWRWGLPRSSISVSSFASSTSEGTTEVEECSSDRVMPWEALASLTASGLIIALAVRWPVTHRLEEPRQLEGASNRLDQP